MKITLKEGQFYAEQVVENPVDDGYVLDQYNAGKKKYEYNESLISEKLADLDKISQEKQSEQEFDYMFLFDEKANIVDCSENINDKLGYKKDEMLNLNLADFDLMEKKGNVAEKIKQIKKQGHVRLKSIHKRKNGSSVLVIENIKYLKDKNVFQCIVHEEPC